jgi:hypothetical protein
VIARHHTRWVASLGALASLAVSTAACDALTDDRYPGEALFALSGTIDSHMTITPSDVNLYLRWSTSIAGTLVVEQIAVKSTFPAKFQLNVFTKPSGPPVHSGDVWPPDDEAVAIGSLVAATSDAEFHDDSLTFPWMHLGQGILGFEPRYMLYYVPDGIVEGSLASLVLHGTYTPGFHLIEVKCIGPARRAEIEACHAQHRAQDGAPDFFSVMTACGSFNPDIPWLQAAPDDLATELTVELFDDPAGWRPDPADCL